MLERINRIEKKLNMNLAPPPTFQFEFRIIAGEEKADDPEYEPYIDGAYPELDLYRTIKAQHIQTIKPGR